MAPASKTIRRDRQGLDEGQARSASKPDVVARRAEKRAKELEHLAARLDTELSRDVQFAGLTNAQLLALYKQQINQEKSYLKPSEDPRPIKINQPDIRIVFTNRPPGYDPFTHGDDETTPKAGSSAQRQAAPKSARESLSKPPTGERTWTHEGEEYDIL